MAANNTTAATSPDAEQDKYLDDALESVKKQGFHMKHAFDGGNIRESLKFASLITSELRTSKLTPKNYYELYMSITDELRELELFFEEEDRSSDESTSTDETKGEKPKSIIELYENVQHAGNIIPRLYLLITVASVYIKSKKAPAKDILFDLVELCRGVQHPMRGLFLRNYLSQVSKDKLPDSGSEYEGAGGTVKDSIEFILQNFAEMNKLWVRMQHAGAVRDRARREKERRNLRQLVGTNLVRLSEMSGVDLSVYQEIVLPRILEQIVNCKDVIAQEYLMDAIIQVFPDDFHLNTLETYLSTCAQLQEQVAIKDILITLMNRLSNYSTETNNISTQFEMFPLFHRYSSKIIQSNNKLSTVDILGLQVALLNFATKVYPDRIQYVDNVLGFSAEILGKNGNKTVEKPAIKLVTELLTLPLEALNLLILNLENYAALLSFLEFDQRRSVATTIIQSIIKSNSLLDSVEKVEKLFQYIEPCIKDETEENKPIAEDERFEFDLEQQLVGKLFQLIKNEDTDIQFQLFQTTRKYFGQGGTNRIQFTLTPLIFSSLQLAEKIYKREESKEEGFSVKSKKLFGFIHETITVLTPHYPVIALRLFLHAASCSDNCQYEAISYEFIAQSFIAYEDEINDSKQQYTAINLIVATLQTLKSFGQENYDTLVSKATQHSAKLLKKVDQCRAVLQCSHLFWPADNALINNRDEKRVLACLQRSLKIANGCMGQQVHLFIEILNKYLFFYDRECPSITVKYLKGLISLIEEHIRTLDQSETSKQAKIHYENTLIHIKTKQQTGGEVGEKYLQITEGDRVESTDVDQQ